MKLYPGQGESRTPQIKFGIGRWIIYSLSFLICLFLSYAVLKGYANELLHFSAIKQHTVHVDEAISDGQCTSDPQYGLPNFDKSYSTTETNGSGRGYTVHCIPPVQVGQVLYVYAYPDSHDAFLSKSSAVGKSATGILIGGVFVIGAFFFGISLYGQKKSKAL